MTDFLVKTFIENHEDIHEPVVRRKYGQLSGTVGIFLNALLFAGKFTAGLISGSIAITADAFNNLSDAASSVITLVGFRLAGQRADGAHPFGHGRMEYLAGLMVSLLILLVGFEIGKASILKIVHPQKVLFSLVSVAILSVSICAKLWMWLWNRRLGRRISSTVIVATSVDSLADVVATSAVLLSMLSVHFFSLNIDAWAGILVAVFILKAGWGAAKETLDPLLGKSADPELVRAIQETVLAHAEILGMHDLMIHDYGPNRAMMSFHAEVPVDGDILVLHDVIDAIERELKDKFRIDTSIHMDPIANNDEMTMKLRDQVAELVRSIHPDMSIHDFRMTDGPLHTNLIFDIVVPYCCPLTDEQAETAVKEAVGTMEGGVYYAVLQLDHLYIAPQ